MRVTFALLLVSALAPAQGIGIITTVAGSGRAGYNGDNIPALQAMFDLAVGDEVVTEQIHITLDAEGNIYIPDQINNRVRKVSAATGIITTVAGSGEHAYGGNGVPALEAALDFPNSVAFDPAGNMYISDQHNNRVRRVDREGVIRTFAGSGAHDFGGNGGPATLAALDFPGGLAFDAAGNLYISDAHNNQVRRVTPAGRITAFAGNTDHAFGGDDGPAVLAALDFPAGLAFDARGNLYIADQHNDRIRRVTPGGIISTFAGNGARGFGGDRGPATNAMLDYPSDVAVDSAGNVYIADMRNNRVRRVAPDGIITTVVGSGEHGYSGDGGPPLSAALDYPSGLAFDRQGALYLSDHHNNRIRKVVFNPPVLVPAPAMLTFASTAGGTEPAAQTVTLTNPGGSALSFTAAADQAWLSVSPAAGTLAPGASVVLTARAAIAVLSAGEYTGQIMIRSPEAANSPQRVSVTLAVRPVTAQPPSFVQAGVVHAASFIAGPIAPGQLISIFGTNLGPSQGLGLDLDPLTGRIATRRGGVVVLFNDIPGPLFFVRQGQINVQTPYELAGQNTARVMVRYLETGSAAVTVPLAPAAPGIFAVTQGRGQAAALNEDSSVNSASNPAARGSVVQIFLTGQGATSPPAVTGELPQGVFPAPVLPVTVTIGGRTAQTLFAGLAPGLAGLMQINAVVPADTTPGDAVALTVSLGSGSSQPGVTLAVRP